MVFYDCMNVFLACFYLMFVKNKLWCKARLVRNSEHELQTSKLVFYSRNLLRKKGIKQIASIYFLNTEPDSTGTIVFVLIISLILKIILQIRFFIHDPFYRNNNITKNENKRKLETNVNYKMKIETKILMRFNEYF